MKLLLIQSGIMAALAGLVLCSVPSHCWPSFGWCGREVDDVNGFLMLPREPAWIKQSTPFVDPGFGIASFNTWQSLPTHC